MHTKHSELNLRSLGILVLLLSVVIVIFQTLPPMSRKPTASSETRFVERSSGGLNIVPASCASSPEYSHAFLAQTADHIGYKTNTGETEYGLARNFVSSNVAWKQTTVAPPGTWKDVSFDDSSWSAAVEEGLYGIAPWLSGVSGIPASTLGQWIWYYDSTTGAGDSTTVYFRRKFKAPSASFTVSFTADNTYVAYLDGVQIASGANMEGPTAGWATSEAVTLNLTPNTSHVLAVQVTNSGGAGGLLVDGGTNYFICITNTSGKSYFVPAGSAAELQSFKSGAVSIPGLTVY